MDRLVAKYIVSDLEPISFVESKALQDTNYMHRSKTEEHENAAQKVITMKIHKKPRELKERAKSSLVWKHVDFIVVPKKKVIKCNTSIVANFILIRLLQAMNIDI